MHRERFNHVDVTVHLVIHIPLRVSNFDQTATAKERMRDWDGAQKVPMSITDHFWQYAKKAILSASFAKAEERLGLHELARTWTQAALLERQSINHHSAAEASAA
jgi:hypothetical protein